LNSDDIFFSFHHTHQHRNYRCSGVWKFQSLRFGTGPTEVLIHDLEIFRWDAHKDMEISVIWEDNVLQLKDSSVPSSPIVEINDVSVSDVLSLSSYDMMLSVIEDNREDDVCSLDSFSTMGMTELVAPQLNVKKEEEEIDDDMFDVQSVDEWVDILEVPKKEEPVFVEVEKPKTGFSFRDALLKNASQIKTPIITKVIPNVPVVPHVFKEISR